MRDSVGMLASGAFLVAAAVLFSLCLWLGFRVLVLLAGVLLERRSRDGW
ncbi:MAG TPA: hypothetical protein VFG69_15260 [Nannocystaceae bacterium]|nr:hypothetical protein [Nannocystaceae bacterium]